MERRLFMQQMVHTMGRDIHRSQDLTLANRYETNSKAQLLHLLSARDHSPFRNPPAPNHRSIRCDIGERVFEDDLDLCIFAFCRLVQVILLDRVFQRV